LEEKKSVTLFQTIEVISELGGPIVVKNSTFISVDDMESKLAKLKDKRARDFDNLSDFSEENIKTWTISYVNFNNDILIVIYQGKEELADIEKEPFDMKVK
jgi:hypothetical protein